MKTVLTLNTVSGKVGVVPASYLTHPVMGKNLVEVPEGTKDYNPEFYQPTDAAGYAEKPSRARRQKAEPEEVVVEEPIEATSDPENL